MPDEFQSECYGLRIESTGLQLLVLSILERVEWRMESKRRIMSRGRVKKRMLPALRHSLRQERTSCLACLHCCQPSATYVAFIGGYNLSSANQGFGVESRAMAVKHEF